MTLAVKVGQQPACKFLPEALKLNRGRVEGGTVLTTVKAAFLHPGSHKQNLTMLLSYSKFLLLNDSGTQAVVSNPSCELSKKVATRQTDVVTKSTQTHPCGH